MKGSDICMEIRFERTGAQRKELVMAISEITGDASNYMGAPGFAYSVGGYIITKDGTLECGETPEREISSLLDTLAGRGILPTETPDFSGVSEGESVTSEAGDDMPDTVSIDLPADSLSDLAFDNLKKLAASKAPLIRSALGENLATGVDTLPIIYEDGKVSFPWFRFGIDANALAAWSFFVTALRDTAKKQKRVVMSDKPYDGSEKYAMRCFLLKLGFIGDEYKEARKVILAGLSGGGSHKNPKKAAPEEDGPNAAYELAEALADAELIHRANASFENSGADDRLVRGGLCCVPPSDPNYASYLRRATDAQLCEAIAHMKSAPDGHKGRIAACSRELAKRGNAADNHSNISDGEEVQYA